MGNLFGMEGEIDDLTILGLPLGDTKPDYRRARVGAVLTF